MAFFATSVPGAQAIEEHHYAGVVLQPGAKRQLPAAGANMMIGNAAVGTGSGGKVCESVYHWYSETWQKTCGTDTAGSWLNQQAWWGEPMTAWVENAGGTARRVDGYWWSWYQRVGGEWGLPKLSSGQEIMSPNWAFKLVMQSDGNLVSYNRSTNKACWWSGTSGHPGAYLVWQPDYNFVIYSTGGAPLFSFGTNNASGSYLAIQNDGNLVAYNAYGNPLWASSWYTGKAGC